MSLRPFSVRIHFNGSFQKDACFCELKEDSIIVQSTIEVVSLTNNKKVSHYKVENDNTSDVELSLTVKGDLC